MHSSKDAKDFEAIKSSADFDSNSEPEPENSFEDSNSENTFESVKLALIASNTPQIKIEEIENVSQEKLEADGQTYTCDRCLLR